MQYHGKAALHLSAENGHEQVADVLLWHKAFVNAKSKLGLTPLHLAAQNGYNELVCLLIETHGAVIDALSLVMSLFFLDYYAV
jgi:ankyrin repeat protein